LRERLGQPLRLCQQAQPDLVAHCCVPASAGVANVVARPVDRLHDGADSSADIADQRAAVPAGRRRRLARVDAQGAAALEAPLLAQPFVQRRTLVVVLGLGANVSKGELLAGREVSGRAQDEGVADEAPLGVFAAAVVDVRRKQPDARCFVLFRRISLVVVAAAKLCRFFAAGSAAAFEGGSVG
jgi:hypothetical protein